MLENDIDKDALNALTEGFDALNQIQALIEKQRKNFKLIMTLVCKNEETIIEQNIRFHKAMGIDNFIVLNHNSTDNTLKILEKLKKEGIVDEIITKTEPQHMHHLWIYEMINLARDKYNATWIINADADEFYFSKSLNLKESIAKANDANVIKCYMNDIFPDGREDFLSCPYFITRPFYNYELDSLGDENTNKIITELSSPKTPKVIHKTEGIKGLSPGNHTIDIESKKEIEAADIVLYHFNIRNYNQLEARIIRWLEAIKYMPGIFGSHMKKLVKIYNEGNLKDYYDARYNRKMRDFLVENGVVTIDTSLYNFLKHNGIYTCTKIS